MELINYRTMLCTALMCIAWFSFSAQILSKNCYKGYKIVSCEEDFDYYRVFTGMTPEGHYAVEYRYNLPNEPLKEKSYYQDEFLSIQVDSSLQYYSNGTFKRSMYYKNGKLDGIVVNYYENGNKASEIEYFSDTENLKSSPYYITAWDKNGNATVQNGDGYFEKYNDERNIYTKGKVKNGKKTGVWISEDRNNGNFLHTSYEDGTIIARTFVDVNGNEKAVDLDNEKEIYIYINRTISSQLYKKLKNKMNENYYAFIYFQIDEKGNLKNTEISKNIPEKLEKNIWKAIQNVHLNPDIINQRYYRELNYSVPIKFAKWDD